MISAKLKDTSCSVGRRVNRVGNTVEELHFSAEESVAGCDVIVFLLF